MAAVSSIAGHKTSVGRCFSWNTMVQWVQRLYDTYGLRRLTSRLLAQQGPTAGTAKNRRNGVGCRDDGGGPPLFLCSSRIELWREKKQKSNSIWSPSAFFHFVYPINFLFYLIFRLFWPVLEHFPQFLQFLGEEKLEQNS